MKVISILIFILIGLINSVNATLLKCLDERSHNDKVVLMLEFQFSNTEMRQDWIYNSLMPVVKMSTGDYSVRPIKRRVVDGKLQATFCIDSKQHFVLDVGTQEYKLVTRPPIGQHFVLDIGPRKYKIATRPINWRSTKYKNRDGKFLREGTMATVFLLEQPDPDWLILRSARLLRSKDENVSLIEIVIDNRSKYSIPIKSIILDVSDPGRNSRISACGGPDTIQIVTLSWEELISTQADSGVWTTIADTDISVKAIYNYKGICSPLSFDATIPVQLTVKERQVSRITLKLKELPAINYPFSHTSRRRFSSRPPPRSLMTWQSFNVEVKTDHLVFPKQLELER